MGNTTETSHFVSKIPKEHDVFMGSIYTTFCESIHLQPIASTLFMDFLAFIYRTVERDSKVVEREEKWDEDLYMLISYSLSYGFYKYHELLVTI